MPNARVLAAAGGLPSRRAALTALAGAGAALSLPRPARAAANPDAHLLALGAALDRQEAAIRPLRADYCCEDATTEADAAYLAAETELLEIIEAIAAVSATTCPGLLVKGRALASLYHEGFTAESLAGIDGDTTDCRLARSILAEIV